MARGFVAAVLSTLILAGAVPAQAIPLTVDYVDSVTGWEWASVAQTTNLSWNQAYGACSQDGLTACASDIGTLEFTGWIWATRDQVRDLFANATDLTAAMLADYGEIETDSTWAPQFLSKFSSTHFAAVQGLSATAVDASSGYIPYLFDNVAAGTNDEANLTTGVGKTLSDSSWGIWLHRPETAAVPEPASLILLGTGLVSVAARARRRRR